MSSDESPTPNPELTEEEAEKLKELQSKDAAARAAADKEAAEKREEEQKERERAYLERPLRYVLVRHMGRSPRTRTMRAARAGHRRQGVLLDDGTRIRKRGKRRFTQVDLRELVNNHQRFLEYVRVGSIEVCDPRTEQAIAYDDLVSGIKALGDEMESFELDESGLQDTVEGSEKPENSAPPPPETTEGEEGSEDGASEGEGGEGEGEETTEGEEEDGESSGYTQEELEKKTRAELDEIAAEYGVEEAESLPNKGAVIEAIFAASETTEEE